jgi:glycine/D-amino acid oxidase-like deaminating enzyme
MNSKKFDIVIVGGGSIALACALEAARSGADIAVVCPVDIGANHGATVAAGAMQGAFGEVTAENHDSPATEFCIDAQHGFSAWVRELSEISGKPIRMTSGTFIVANAASPEDNVNIQAIEAKLMQKGEPYQRLDPRDVAGLAPHSSVATSSALFIEREGTVNPRQLLWVMRRLLEAQPNVTLITSRASNVSEEDGGLVVTLHPVGEVLAHQVIVAAGAHSMSLVKGLIPETATTLRMFAGQGSAVELEAELKHTLRTPNRGTACGLHAVPSVAGRVYVGATNRPRAVRDAATGPAAEEIHQLLDGAIHEINTEFSKAAVRNLHFGLRPVTADNLPIVGRTSREGLFLATGTHRTGILMSPEIARMVVSEAVGSSPVMNPFAITEERLKNISYRDNSDAVRQQIPAVLDEYLQPNGYLPYDRREGLIRIITALYDVALRSDEQQASELRSALNRYPDFAAMSLMNSRSRRIR